MQIIIDIEECRYNWIMAHASNDARDYDNSMDLCLRKAIESGVVLPEEHGDLIDRDVAREEFDKACCSWEGGILKYIPAIIPGSFP